MCTSSEGNPEILPHIYGHVQSTLNWLWKNQIADRGDVALFKRKRKTPWSWCRTPFVQKNG